MTTTGRQSTSHHEMLTKGHALKEETPIYNFFFGGRESPLLVQGVQSQSRESKKLTFLNAISQ